MLTVMERCVGIVGLLDAKRSEREIPGMLASVLTFVYSVSNHSWQPCTVTTGRISMARTFQFISPGPPPRPDRGPFGVSKTVNLSGDWLAFVSISWISGLHRDTTTSPILNF